MIEGSLAWRQKQAASATSEQAAKGNKRAASVATTLRKAGFNVERAPIVRKYGRRYKTTIVPFAPAWAIDLVEKLQRARVSNQMRRKILVEARELGEPGPLALELFVANKMME